jgi:hypothetical protein
MLIDMPHVNYTERGLTAVPVITPFVPPGELVGYTDSINDQGGFEHMQATYVLALDDALAWFENGLMRGVATYGPDADTVWEGFVSGMELRIGQEARSISIENMANRLRCTYTTVLGTPGTTTSMSDAVSIDMYGTKDHVAPLGSTTATAALNLALRLLATYSQPRPSASISIATGSPGDVQLTIIGSGWYTTLGWVVTSRASTSTTSTTTQVGALLDTASPGIGQTNAFLSTSTLSIVSSGNSDTEFIAANTTYQQKIEALLTQGDSAGDALAWGVYENRVFFVEIAADATPGTIHYTRSLGEGIVRDAYGGEVYWWQVRPNRMYQVQELLDTNPAIVGPDNGGKSYIARRTVTIGQGQIGLTLEGRTGDTIDRIIASMK